MPKSYNTAIASCCVGRSFAGHKLPDKLSAIKAAGFTGVEIFVEDLEAYAHDLTDRRNLPFSSSFTQAPENVPSREELLSAAEKTKTIAQDLDLEIIVFQPLQYYEGEQNLSLRKAKWEQADLFVDITGALGAGILQVTCHYRTEETSGDTKVLAKDLSDLADKAAKVGARVAYEPICWGAYADTWQKTWEIVKAADNPNLGLILDTYHILGKLYADPTSSTGLLGTQQEATARLNESLASLSKTIPPEKIFFVQLSDIAFPDKPLNESHPFYDPALFGPLHMWSRNGRPNPYEGYTPVGACAKAIAATGFDGYWSIETFNVEARRPGASVPLQEAERAMKSWLRIQHDLEGN